MEKIEQDHFTKVGNLAVKALTTNGFKAQFTATKQEALQAVLALIDEKASVGFGGSMTTKALGIQQALEKRGNIVYNHQGLTKEESLKVRRQENNADVLLASSNAITLQGELINVDGSGNRVAGMIFGPKRVIIVAGANKIVRDEAAGRERIKMLAAPMNTARLNCQTPCAKTGVCVDCHIPARICNVTTIIHRPPSAIDFHIIIVGEALGY